MNNERCFFLSIVAVLAIIVTSAGWGQLPAPAAPAEAIEPAEKAADGKNFWMDQKLKLSTQILAGLAEADFEKIGRSAGVMRGLNRVEAFVRRGPEGYRDELKLFNMANQEVARAAKEKNLEAATLAFNRLTVSCVSCHQRLRRLDQD